MIALCAAIMIFLNLANTVLAFYTDVQPGNKYYTAIKSLYDKGMLPEYSDNLFHPDARVKTKDLYELILAYGKTDSIPSSVKQSSDTNKALPKNSVLSTIFKILGIGTNYLFDKTKFTFKDIKTDSDNAAIAMRAEELGIIESNPKLFKSAKRVTKAEVADYLYKIDQYSEDVPTLRIEFQSIPSGSSGSDGDFVTNSKFPILSDVWKNLKNDFYYKGDITDEKLVYGAIKGITEATGDKYTSFQAPDEKNILNTLTLTEYEGIGMLIDTIKGNVTVVSPFKDSPAEKAGLKPNDIIKAINGEDITGQTAEVAAIKIKGPAGTTVKIKVSRSGEELEFNVIRAKVNYSSVQSKTIEKNGVKIGYITINTFADQTYDQFVKAAKDIKKDNIAGFIIDLRNNPGGFMDTAIKLVGLFTDEIKTAVELAYANGTKEAYKTDGNGLLKGYKVVILINEGSASASEIMAGALHDYGIAKLIGAKTFGKGCVQKLLQYADGSKFKYTISKWLTPLGTDINEKGIAPDKIVENPESGEDAQYQAALAEF